MEDIKNMSNFELGVIAKAFVDCEWCKNCLDCPCDGVLCGRRNLEEARVSFVREVARRLMESE